MDVADVEEGEAGSRGMGMDRQREMHGREALSGRMVSRKQGTSPTGQFKAEAGILIFGA